MRWRHFVSFLLISLLLMLSACSKDQQLNDNALESAEGSTAALTNAETFADNDPLNPLNLATIDTVIDALQNPEEWVVIDVRTPEEYNGESRLPNAYGSGRIKGAVNVNRELVSNSDGDLLPQDELLELFDFIGDKSAIVYCHGGVRSAFVWTVLYDLGFNVLNYSGSWVDWSRAASIASDYPSDIVLSFTEEWTDNEGEI